LTPSQKKLQDGTRAVARQITNDILPSLGNLGPTSLPDFQLFPKIGTRVLEALGNQAKNTLRDIQGDLADPSRIPQRLTQQTEDILQEAKNVFLETPQGLQGPAYSVVTSSEAYEIRDYEGYTVASTVMNPIGEPYKEGNFPSNGAAFNALAAYLFGANTAGKSMEMTTPVTTTSLGEMRFFLSAVDVPAPLDQTMYDTGTVQIVDIPSARLAVRKFTGFVTEGEVSRQKDVLLSNLALDGIEIDVPHGAVVPHVIFQYNPPYTVPMIRRNEIAVPVRTRLEQPPKIEEEWRSELSVEEEWIGEIPSDVE
jgi:SOUL heme-binding protein